MTRSPFSRLRALVIASIVSVALLASGCAQGGSNETSTSAAPATQAAGAASDKPTSDKPASAKPEPTGPVTDWTTVTAEASGLSFSAPADWKVIKASELQADEAKLEEAANEAGMSADALKTAMSTADIYILDQAGAQQGVPNNINVLSQTYPANTTVTEDALAAGVKSIGATPGRFSTESTANGDAYVLTYTWEMGGQTLEGAVMYIPNTDGKYVSVTVTTLDTALTGQIVSKIIATAA